MFGSVDQPSLSSSALQDPGRCAGFHPSGAVLAVGTMTGRSGFCLDLTRLAGGECAAFLTKRGLVCNVKRDIRCHWILSLGGSCWTLTPTTSCLCTRTATRSFPTSSFLQVKRHQPELDRRRRFCRISILACLRFQMETSWLFLPMTTLFTSTL